MTGRFRHLSRTSSLALTLLLPAGLAVADLLTTPRLSAQSPVASTPRVLGTVQSISGNAVTVLSDLGNTSTVSIESATKLLQIEPGKTDLKETTPLSLSDLQPGDRVLVRGVMAEDGKTLRAASLIAMKKAAIADKQSKERAEWQRGVGGLVKSIDPSAQTIVLTTNGVSSPKEMTLHLAKNSILRRYAPDSTRFDAAKPAPLSAVQVGDQLRARGSRESDPAHFDAAEIVSGSFRNIAGTISGVDAPESTVVVQDLALKAPVMLKITAESQMRKLPQPFAERIAALLKGQGADTAPQGGGAPAAPQTPSGGAPNSAPAQGAGPAGASGSGTNRGPGGGGGDFQQMLARMPAATLADLQKGDAVMVVATPGNGKDPVTVITLLSGVD